VTGSRWSKLPPELLVSVLGLLQASSKWRASPEGGLGFCKPVAVVRAVCADWQAVHDALVMLLAFRLYAGVTDEAMGMLVRRFLAVAPSQAPHALSSQSPSQVSTATTGACDELSSLTSELQRLCDERHLRLLRT
jgi:hypothetical protein